MPRPTLEEVLLNGDCTLDEAEASVASLSSRCASARVVTLLQRHADNIDGPAADRAVTLLAMSVRLPEGRAALERVLAEVLLRIDEADSPAALRMRDVLLHTLQRAASPVFSSALQACVLGALLEHVRAGGRAQVDAVPQIAVGSCTDLVGLQTAGGPLLKILETRLSTEPEAASRVAAVAVGAALWQRAQERWPEDGQASDWRQLAAALANVVADTVKYDPAAKVRLSAVRLLASLCPCLSTRPTVALMSLKLRDRDKEVRKAALKALEALDSPEDPLDLDAAGIAALVRHAGDHALANRLVARFFHAIPPGGAASALHALGVMHSLPAFEPHLDEHAETLYASQFGASGPNATHHSASSTVAHATDQQGERPDGGDSDGGSGSDVDM